MQTDTSTPRKHSGGLGFRRLWFDIRHRRQRHRQTVGVLLVLVFTLLGQPSPLQWGIGAGIVAAGMLIRMWASGIVHKNDVLATTGPYGFVRHPLYVGNILIGIGFCVASGLLWSYAAFLAILLYFYPHTIRYEDRKLRRLFGEQWDEWASRTRALIPRLPVRDGASEKARWSGRLSFLRNGEPIHVLIGGLCLAWLYYRIV